MIATIVALRFHTIIMQRMALGSRPVGRPAWSRLDGGVEDATDYKFCWLRFCNSARSVRWRAKACCVSKNSSNAEQNRATRFSGDQCKIWSVRDVLWTNVLQLTKEMSNSHAIFKRLSWLGALDETLWMQSVRIKHTHHCSGGRITVFLMFFSCVAADLR